MADDDVIGWMGGLVGGRDETGKHQSTLVYGEITFNSFGIIFEKVRAVTKCPWWVRGGKREMCGSLWFIRVGLCDLVDGGRFGTSMGSPMWVRVVPRVCYRSRAQASSMMWAPAQGSR